MSVFTRLRHLEQLFSSSRAIGVIYLLSILTVTIIQFVGPLQMFGDIPVTHYNNFIIFRSSFGHLLEGMDLYAGYPGEYYDLFKYSPTFAFLMAPWSVLPDFPGLLLWNLLNGMLLFWAIRNLPLNEKRNTNFVLLLILPELIGATQNSQSNALMAALIIFSFVFLERDLPVWAAFVLVVGFYIKIFSLAAVCLFLFYPRKTVFVLAFLGWFLGFLILPLVVVSPAALIQDYTSWFNVLRNDYTNLEEYSVMALARAWLGWEGPKLAVLVVGVVVVALAFLRRRCYPLFRFRLLMLSALLIWVVIFNHNAESPVFVIAMTGVGLWFVSQRPTLVSIALVGLALLFTSVTSMDIIPAEWDERWVGPYKLKGLFSVVIWMKVMWELYTTPAVPDGQVST